jgi:MFS family permease
VSAASRTPANNWAVVVAAGVCGAVGAFDLGGVNVVLPQLADTFDVDPAAVQWVVLAYLLPIAALALPTGRWLDTVGRRSAIILLVAGFTVASILVGCAPTLALVIAARALQGCFGAGVFAMTAVLAYQAVEPAKRVRAIAIVSTISPLGGIAGPSIGAFIAEALGWEWIFWLNVPILAAAIGVFALRMPSNGRLHWPSAHFMTEVLLLGGATSAVLLALTWAPEYQLAWLILALLAIPCLVVWRLTHRGSPVLKLTSIPGYTWSITALALLAASTMAVQYLLAFFAQRTLGMSVATTGLALLFISIGTISASLTAGWLTTRFRLRSIALCGFCVSAIAIFSIAVLGTGWNFAVLAGLGLFLGIGQGLANTPGTTIALSFSPPELAATSGSAMSFLRNVGFTTGPALMTTIWALGAYSLVSMRAALIVAGFLAVSGAVSVRLATRAGRAAAATAFR